MIPKIAYFHWTGHPMSWLRSVGVESFRFHNPDWDVRVVPTHPDVNKDLPYGNQADWTNWIHLHETGGFKIDTDIVWVKPLPEDWLDQELVACMGSYKGFPVPHHIGAIGSTPGTWFMGEAVRRCSTIKSPEYQTLGADLLRNVWVDGTLEGGHHMSVLSFPANALTKYNEHDTKRLFGGESLEIDELVLGVHWYGNHDYVRTMEPWMDPTATFAPIVRLANEYSLVDV